MHASEKLLHVPLCSPVHTQTKFVILMHPMEFKKIKNGTGVLSHLMLSNSEIIIDVDFSKNDRVNECLSVKRMSLLFFIPAKAQ